MLHVCSKEIGRTVSDVLGCICGCYARSLTHAMLARLILQQGLMQPTLVKYALMQLKGIVRR